MKRNLALALAAMLFALPAMAQTAQNTQDDNARDVPLQYFRPYDGRGVNMFEPPKFGEQPEFKGVNLQLGGAFTQQFQALDHSNGSLTSPLMPIGSGFNTATANMRLDAQLAPGIRLNSELNLSSRHHNETWVNAGYLQIDALPIKSDKLNVLMAISRIRAGHMVINYGDSQFRRTSNAMAIYNPFVGNPLMDSYATEIGAEGYVFLGPFMAMGGVTGGEIKGGIQTPEKRSPAWLGKVAFDKTYASSRRARLSGSFYTVSKSPASTLYAGDRAGSRYYFVLESPAATANAQFRSGLIEPGFSRNVTAVQVNPFVKFGGLEFFGIVEQAEGRSWAENADRKWKHLSGDAIYRFSFGESMAKESLYAAIRYNIASGRLQNVANDVSARRIQVALGQFLTPHILLKAEYVNQVHRNYPETHILNKGKFHGAVVEGVIAF